ncbi:unnamed protein product [Parnassius apollo]|uniref:(apollo) hypothetical protein n=1 Tax=Parnassius apollo TaxID=110799 RepID=A0A8S3WCG6_PARAO|nr:unnamed protein product [Parnassius apollo]
MQKSDRWSEDKEGEAGKSRPTSRRNSGSHSRRGSKEEPKENNKGISTAPHSSNSTPKRTQKVQDFDFVVTGKQILKRADRASSLPGSHRRPSLDSLSKHRRLLDSPKRFALSQPSKSRDTSLDEDMSLELSQVSDFEDMNSKYGIKNKFSALATSTPKRQNQKPRSGSLQNQAPVRELPKRGQKSLDSKHSRQSTFSYSRDSLYKTSSSSPYRPSVSTELDCSSVSPEYSAASSGDSVGAPPDTLITPRSQELNDSSVSHGSCCVSTWQESGVGAGSGSDGEWAHFWARYNGPHTTRELYDLCPTPYRNDLDLADFELSTNDSMKRSPDNLASLNNLIKSEGLHLTAKETQNVIKCAHILGNVVTIAIERRTKEKEENTEKIQEIKNQTVDKERETKRKTLSLNLRETNLPVEVKEEKRWETVTTQTDISLPNTKSAPKIFEKILRQLSRSSIEDGVEKKAAPDAKEENKEEPKPAS